MTNPQEPSAVEVTSQFLDDMLEIYRRVSDTKNDATRPELMRFLKPHVKLFDEWHERQIPEWAR